MVYVHWVLDGPATERLRVDIVLKAAFLHYIDHVCERYCFRFPAFDMLTNEDPNRAIKTLSGKQHTRSPSSAGIIDTLS
jgi:hypothetical protein